MTSDSDISGLQSAFEQLRTATVSPFTSSVPGAVEVRQADIQPSFIPGPPLQLLTSTPQEDSTKARPEGSGFEVLEFDPTDGKVVLSKGCVISIDPNSSASPVLKPWTPSNWTPTAEFTGADGQTLYAKVTTTEKDQVSAVILEVAATDTDSTHAQPGPAISPQVTVNGEYYYPLVEFYTDGGELFYRQIHTGTIVHRPVLWTGKNIGAAVELYKQHKQSTNEFEFRTLKNIATGTGVSVLKDDESPQGDNIQFRKIDAASASPLQVSLDGDTVTIEGNGVAGTAAINLGGEITVQDGLVTVLTEGTQGDDFNLVNYACDMSSPPASPSWTIYFRKGLAFLADPDPLPPTGTTYVMYDGFSCTPPAGGP